VDSPRPEAEHEKETIPQPNLGESILEGLVRLMMMNGAQKHAQQRQHQRPPRAWPVMRHLDMPRAARLAREKGSAMPTRNENDG
jgi:hypothetical protein